MIRTRALPWLVLPLLLAPVLGYGPALAAPASNDPVRVTVDQKTISTKLGHAFEFRTSIANTGTTDVAGVIAHLNVLSLRDGTYVDPEDWSSHRTRYLALIAAGGSTTISWNLHAVNAGSFGVYVALVRSDGTALLNVSPPVRVAVADRRTLNSGGIVPLVIAMPVLLGLLWGLVRLGRSKSRLRRSNAGAPSASPARASA